MCDDAVFGLANARDGASANSNAIEIRSFIKQPFSTLTHTTHGTAIRIQICAR
jgi:hypothetical protein